MDEENESYHAEAEQGKQLLADDSNAPESYLLEYLPDDKDQTLLNDTVLSAKDANCTIQLDPEIGNRKLDIDSKEWRRDDIDGIRAVAVFGAVTFHLFPGLVPGGFLGVDIFFFLSGYLITGIILRDLDSFSFLTFYARRIRRIFPALLCVLSTVSLASLFYMYDEEYKKLGRHVAAASVFSSNMILWSEVGYFDEASHLKPLLHLWSLGIEEQFYIFWPIFLVLFRKQQKVCLAVSILSFACYISLRHSFHPLSAFYLLPARAWEILVGGFFAFADVHGTTLPFFNAGNAHFLSPIGLICIGLCYIHPPSIVLEDGAWSFGGLTWNDVAMLVPAFGTAGIVTAGKGAVLNHVFLGHAGMVYLGKISYPLYLWHWPLLSFLVILGFDIGPVVALTVGVVSVCLAYITYIFIEIPVQHNMFWRSGYGMLMLCGLLFFIGGLGGLSALGIPLHQRSQFLRWFHRHDGTADANNMLAPYTNTSSTTLPPGVPLAVHEFSCSQNNISSPNQAWLLQTGSGEIIFETYLCYQSHPGLIDTLIIGDSHASSLFAGLATAMPAYMVGYYGAFGDETCLFCKFEVLREFGKSILSNKKKDASAKAAYNIMFKFFHELAADKFIKRIFFACFWFNKSPKHMEEIQHGITVIVSLLIDNGKQVYLMGDVPTIPKLADRNKCQYATAAQFNSACRLSLGEEFQTNARHQQALFSAIAATCCRTPPTYVNLAGIICTDIYDSCLVANEKTHVIHYKDNHHLSQAGSIYLTQHFVPTLYYNNSI